MSNFKENGLGIHAMNNGQKYVGPKIDGRFDTTAGNLKLLQFSKALS